MQLSAMEESKKKNKKKLVKVKLLPFKKSEKYKYTKKLLNYSNMRQFLLTALEQ